VYLDYTSAGSRDEDIALLLDRNLLTEGVLAVTCPYRVPHVARLNDQHLKVELRNKTTYLDSQGAPWYSSGTEYFDTHYTLEAPMLEPPALELPMAVGADLLLEKDLSGLLKLERQLRGFKHVSCELETVHTYMGAKTCMWVAVYKIRLRALGSHPTWGAHEAAIEEATLAEHNAEIILEAVEAACRNIRTQLDVGSSTGHGTVQEDVSALDMCVASAKRMLSDTRSSLARCKARLRSNERDTEMGMQTTYDSIAFHYGEWIGMMTEDSFDNPYAAWCHAEYLEGKSD
jgi:hypothetical protein